MRANYLIHSISVALLSIAIASAATPAAPPGWTVLEDGPPADRSLYLVQTSTLSASERSVGRVSAKVDREFEIIHAVSAYLTAEQADQLRNTAGVHVFRDRMLSSRSLGSLLGSVVTSVTSTVGAVAAPVVTAATPIVTPVTQIAAPVTNPVLTLVTPLASPVVTPLIAPVVTSVGANMTLQDGTGVGSSRLLS
jgi:hypothetical protein